MRKKSWLLPALALMASLSAGEQIIRTGTLLEWKILPSAPAVADLSQSPYTIPKQPVFAAVSVTLAPSRSLSILDYSLLLDGRIISCVAIAGTEATKQFRYTTEVFRTPGTYHLLFIMDKEQWERRKSLKFSSNLPPVNIYEVTL